MQSMDHWGSPRPLQDIHNSNSFHNVTKPEVTVCYDGITACIDAAKVMMGKISGVFTHQSYGTKLDQQSCYSDGLTSEKTIVLKNVLGEAAQIINLTKTQSLTAHLFNIVCDRSL